jgi:prepilin-type N-terminal cleavage/methylation domain-containing protein
MCGSSRGNGGFSLLETVIALAIVAMVAVASLATLGTQTRAAARTVEVLPAAILADQRLGVMRLLVASDLDILPDSIEEGRFPAPLDRYEWTAGATPVPGESGLYEVSVRVTWHTGSYLLRTRLFRPVTEHQVNPS